MSSIRRTLKVNVNDSKNTRMDVAGPLASWKPDEIGHISRYTKIADMIIKESKRLGRPIDLLEAGCGNCWPLRHMYKSIVIKKSLIVSSYLGVDIDPMVLDEYPGWPIRRVDGTPITGINDSTWFHQYNGEVVIQDLTVDPIFPVSEEGECIDFFWTTEVIEHMKPEFIEPWIADAADVLRPGGLAYISTPNKDGSNDKLPEDHIYEWGHQELIDLLSKYFEIVDIHGIFTQVRHFNRAHKALGRWPDNVVADIRRRFSPEFQRVILATAYPETSNNAAFVLRKKS